MKVFVKVSEHKNVYRPQPELLIEWNGIVQTIVHTYFILICNVIMLGNLTLKLYYDESREPALKISTRFLSQELWWLIQQFAWAKADQGCCCWIWITGKKLSDILPNMNCKPISVRVTLSEMFLRAWSWFWIKTFLDWSTNHHIHYSEISGEYSSLWKPPNGLYVFI